MKKLIRTSTIALSLDVLLKGQLHFLNQYYEVLAISGQDEHLDSVKNREGINVLDVSMQRKISPLKDLISLVKLYKVFKKEKPYIVHSITPKAGLLCMTAAYFAGVPIRIHTFTGLIFPSKKGVLQKVLILMDKILCKFATHIFPEGQGVKNDLIHYKITKKPLKIIANGNVNGINIVFYSIESVTEIDKINLRKSLEITTEDFVFIFVGRLVKDKGINELVSAFSKIKNKRTKLILVGPLETDLDPLSESTLEEIKNNKNVITTGYQNDVRPYFAIANALVFPSYREGFPNVVMQAGAMGLPSIVTDINGSNEIIINNKNGLIIPVKNEASILESMLELVENKDLYEQLKKNAREMVVCRYKQQLVWEGILYEYQLLENKESNVE